jgi:hypothetical protein
MAIARQRQQHARGQQCSSGVFWGPRGGQSQSQSYVTTDGLIGQSVLE